MQKNRVLISILNLKGLSGAVNYVLNTAKILKETYHFEVAVLTSKKDKKDYPVKTIKAPLISNLKGYIKRAAFCGFSNMMARNYDIVNGHGELINQDILTLHNLVHKTYETFNKPQDGLYRFHDKMLRTGKFKKIIANSNFMKKDLIRRFSLPEEKIQVIYPGYQPKIKELTSSQNKSEARNRLSVKENEFLIVLPTSGDFKKRGVQNFIEIISKLSACYPQIKAIITGKEKNLSYYRSLAQNMNLAEKISFIPPLQDVHLLYKAADLVIYPAEFEEFGIALCEAMICEIPVLCSENIGACELMSVNCREFSICQTNEEFVKKALHLIKTGLDKSIFAENYKNILPNTWEKTAKETALLYQSLS